METGDPVEIARRPAPAGDVEADRGELARRVGAEHAEPEQADAHFGGRGLVVVVGPDRLVLLPVVHALLAQVDQRMQDDPFAHAVAQVGIDRADDRRFGQKGIAEEMVDAGAEREDRREIGQIRERARADGAS